MAVIQEKALDQYLCSNQITNTTSVIRYFLTSIFIICLYIFCLYTFFYEPSNYLTSWFICTELFVSINLLVSIKFFKHEKYSIKNADIWINSVCLITGLLIASGITLLYILASRNSNFDIYEAVSLGALLIIVCLLFALTFLSQRVIYFTLCFVPTIIPFIYAQFNIITEQHPLFFLTTNFALIMMFVCAVLSMRLQRNLSYISLKNTQLIKEAEQQIEVTDQLNKQLLNEMNRSKVIEKKLQNHSLTLEQKIKERTLDLEKIHQDLRNKQTNLVLAHDIAGLIPWDWNIKDRTISFSDKLNRTHFKNSDLDEAKLLNLIHPDDLEHFRTELRKHLKGISERFEATYRVKRYDGKWYWVHDIGSVIVRDPKTNRPLHMVGIRRDIHQERLDQERLKLSASVLNQAAEGILILNEDFKYVDVNPFFAEITGFSRDQIIGKHLFDIAANYKANQRSIHNQIITEIINNGIYEGEMTEKFLSGKEVVIRFHINAVRDEENRIINYIGIVSDLSENKLQEQRLSYLENYDALTDLPNRLYYNYQLHQHLVTQYESIHQLAIIRLNIDRFRPLNEYFSNSGGDELLKQVAQRLRLNTVEAFLVAHLNSDNFAIVYEPTHVRLTIQQYCEKIADIFNTPFLINDEEVTITISMGVSLYPEHGRQVDYLNNCAEQALKEAKYLGGNTTKIYSNDSNSQVEPDIVLERELRHAIRNDELVVYYQPKVQFSDQHIQGFEALIRWNHPVKGLISPQAFIPLAEQTSLISEIGLFVIQKTAEQIHKWKSMGFEDIRVSFNVAAQQLHRGNLLEKVDEVIEKYQISGSNLELEITESSLLEKSKAVKQTLNEIKKRNIQISLDDFGTGYSSLSYLTDFPIDILKIDKSFVSQIGEKKQDAIVNAIVSMGKAMGMTIVAEGIETEEQLKYLEQLNCDLAQGYFFSKPLPEQEATIFLKCNDVTSGYNYLI